ncbi:MAG: energy transducer TonB [Longimicrobiales bacterium]
MKRRSEAILPESIVLAVLLHVALFTFAPDITSADEYGAARQELYVVPPPETDIPDPPEAIARPAAPVPSAGISTEVTITSTRLDDWRPEIPKPPEHIDRGAAVGFRLFVPSMVAPHLLNPDEVERELRRTYPAILREAGIGGDVDVNLWLDETGAVVKAVVGRSSGYKLLDEAALKVVDAMRLAPAQNRGLPVRVIVTLPVRFNVR